jgi:transposase IS66-like protein
MDGSLTLGSVSALVSIVETAKANGLEPNAYLRLIFEKLPQSPSTTPSVAA